jgi:hypothetical protein
MKPREKDQCCSVENVVSDGWRVFVGDEIQVQEEYQDQWAVGG